MNLCKLSGLAGLTLLASGCAMLGSTQSPNEPAIAESAATETPSSADTAAMVLEAQSRPESLEVAPLESPAISMLVSQSDAAVSTDELAQASILIERALRIEPYNPRLWQRLAEIRVAQKRYIEAEEMAMRSYGQSARVGEWCRRNWLTLRETRKALGDPAEAEKAQARAEECVLAPPPRY